MSADAGSIDPEEAQRRASALHLDAGMTVQELNWDEDADPVIRSGIEAVIGGDLVDEDFDDVVDAVVMWWRDDDGISSTVSSTPSDRSPITESSG